MSEAPATGHPQTAATSRRPGRAATWSLMAAHVVLSAGTYVLAKFAAVGFPDPQSLTLARALGAALLLLPLSGWLVPAPRFSPREWLAVALLGLLLVALNQFSFLRGMRSTTPGHPPLLFALTPIVVLAFTSLWRRRLPARRKTLGVALSFAGVVALLRPWQAGAEIQELRSGDAWILIAVLAWALYTVAVAELCRRHDARTVTSFSLILGALLFLPWGWPALAGTAFRALPASAWVGLAWLAAVTSVVMMLVWNVLLRYLEPVEVAVCANAQPPATAALVALLSGLGLLEGDPDLGPYYWAGMAAILTGIVLVQQRTPPRLTTSSATRARH